MQAKIASLDDFLSFATNIRANILNFSSKTTSREI